MKKSTKEKTKYRALQWTFFGGEFLSIFAPFITIGAIKFDEYFTNNPDGWKITTGGIICLAVLGFAVLMTTRAKEKSLDMNPLITLLIGWVVVALIMFLLSSILNDIAIIMFFGAIGIAGALGLDIASGEMKKKADVYKTAKKKLQEDNAYEELKTEQEQPKKKRIRM